MKPNYQAKLAGLKSMKEFSELTGWTRRTLQKWARVKPELFKAELDRAVKRKELLSNK